MLGFDLECPQNGHKLLGSISACDPARTVSSADFHCRRVRTRRTKSPRPRLISVRHERPAVVMVSGVPDTPVGVLGMFEAAGIEPAAGDTARVTTPDKTCQTADRTCRIPDNLMVCIGLRPGLPANTGQSRTEPVESRIQLCPLLAPFRLGCRSRACRGERADYHVRWYRACGQVYRTLSWVSAR